MEFRWLSLVILSLSHVASTITTKGKKRDQDSHGYPGGGDLKAGMSPLPEL